jgi:N-acetylglucosamine-6-phosphate deacetylase
VNGYGGQEFSSTLLTVEKVAGIVRQHYAFGVTGICPTLTTQSLATLEHGVRVIAGACEKFPDVGRRVVGIHLEGPFITSGGFGVCFSSSSPPPPTRPTSAPP